MSPHQATERVDAAAPLFLGLDCSTQSMSGVVVNDQGLVVCESSLRFDESFPHYGTDNGVLRVPGKDSEVVIPSMMFVEALDAILKELSARVDLGKVGGVSGSAQQHASVFWRKGFSVGECLDAAGPGETIVQAMKKQPVTPFYLENGPSWMDSSTTQFCNDLESAVGGADRVAQISGSRAYERFTGNQIAKRIHDDPSFLDNVGRVALVSSMLTSLLCGDFTPIDESDGSGMNLLDVRERKWSPELLRATASYGKTSDAAATLQSALGEEICRSYDSLGPIHPYFQRAYGFAADCVVIPFSGDNPCTLAGIGLSQAGDVGISLGTSSTLMAVVPTAEARFSGEEGHFFRNPVDPDTLMVRASLILEKRLFGQCCDSQSVPCYVRR
jgi:xylulokinase